MTHENTYFCCCERLCVCVCVNSAKPSMSTGQSFKYTTHSFRWLFIVRHFIFDLLRATTKHFPYTATEPCAQFFGHPHMYDDTNKIQWTSDIGHWMTKTASKHATKANAENQCQWSGHRTMLVYSEAGRWYVTASPAQHTPHRNQFGQLIMTMDVEWKSFIKNIALIKYQHALRIACETILMKITIIMLVGRSVRRNSALTFVLNLDFWLFVNCGAQGAWTLRGPKFRYMPTSIQQCYCKYYLWKWPPTSDPVILIRRKSQRKYFAVNTKNTTQWQSNKS